jgi:uncharacterized protein (TIGR03086 family)
VVTTRPAGVSYLSELVRDSLLYARSTVGPVTVAEMSYPTPCRQWDLRTLLDHLNDSLVTLYTACRTGQVGLEPGPPGSTDEATLATFERYSDLLLTGDPLRAVRRDIMVVDLPLAENLLLAAGAIELSMHGWDVGQATGVPGPLPEELAIGLLAIAPLVVDDAFRSPLFGPVVGVAPGSGAATRLLAYLGRGERAAMPYLS